MKTLNFNPIPKCRRIIINKDDGFLISILQNKIPEFHYFVYEIVLYYVINANLIIFFELEFLSSFLTSLFNFNNFLMFYS